MADSQAQSILPSAQRDRFEQLRLKYKVPGLVVSAITSTEYEGSWASEVLPLGYYNTKGDSVDAETLFPIASNAKIFTALAIGLLIRQGVTLANGESLGWSTKIKDVLTEWGLERETDSDLVDITDLLSMNSGLPGHDKSYGIHSPAEMVLNMRNLRMSTETEKQKACQYNNIHYIALALIITRLSGTPFDEYLQKNIFNSLDIRPFLNVMDAKETGRLSDGWLRSDIDYEVCAKSGGFGEACLGVPRSIGYWLKGDGLYRAGPGGMMMCGNDMVKWLTELLSPQYLPLDLLQRLAKPIAKFISFPYPEHTPAWYGTGLFTWSYRGYEIIGHTGGQPGGQSIHLRIPSRGIALMVAINDEMYGREILRIIAYEIVDQLLHLEPMDWEGIIMANNPRAKRLPPTHDHIEPPPQDIAGTFSAPGYGSYHFIAYTMTNQGDASHPELRLDPVDPTVAHNPNKVRVIQPHIPKLPLGTRIYIAEVDKLFASHLIITPLDGSRLEWTSVYVRELLHDDVGTGEYGICEITSGMAIYDHTSSQSRIGLFGNFWVGSEGRIAVGEEIDHAEVILCRCVT